MDHMPSPFKTLTSLAAIGLGVTLLTGPANAVPTATPSDLTSPGFQVRRRLLEPGKAPLALRQGLLRAELCRQVVPRRALWRSDEIRELQRFDPETLWPPSMRYFHILGDPSRLINSLAILMFSLLRS
jgi:hypothetical protein